MDAFRHDNQDDVIYTDFTKAFDKVNYTVLLKVMDEFGFSIRYSLGLIHT